MKNHFTIDEVREFWDRVSDVYDGINLKIGSSHYQRFTEGLKLLGLKDGDKVLNIWSRTGNAIKYINELAKVDLYNLEVSPKMTAMARAKFPEARFGLTSLNKIDFDDNFFDAILSLETLEHAPESETYLGELFRVLKRGQILVMSLPPKTAEWPLKIYEKFFHNHGEGPHRFLPSKTVKKMIKKAGFELLMHKGTILIPVGPRFLQKWGEIIIEKMQKTPISELGIRQFYVCRKPMLDENNINTVQ